MTSRSGGAPAATRSSQEHNVQTQTQTTAGLTYNESPQTQTSSRLTYNESPAYNTSKGEHHQRSASPHASPETLAETTCLQTLPQTEAEEGNRSRKRQHEKSRNPHKTTSNLGRQETRAQLQKACGRLLYRNTSGNKHIRKPTPKSFSKHRDLLSFIKWVFINTVLLCDYTHHHAYPTILSPILKSTLATLSSHTLVTPYTTSTLRFNHLSKRYPPLPQYIKNLLRCNLCSFSKLVAPPRISRSPPPAPHPKPTNHTVSKKPDTYLQENIYNLKPENHKHTKITNLPSNARHHLPSPRTASSSPSPSPATFEHASTIPEQQNPMHPTTESNAYPRLIHPTTESNANEPPRPQHRSPQIPHTTNKTTTATAPTPPTSTGRPPTTTHSIKDTRTPIQANPQLTPKPTTRQTLTSTFMHLSKLLSTSPHPPQKTIHTQPHSRLQIPLPLTHFLISFCSIHPLIPSYLHSLSDMAPTPEKTTQRSHKTPATDTSRLEIQLRSKLKTTRSLGTVTKNGHKKATSLDIAKCGIASRRQLASVNKMCTGGDEDEHRHAANGPGSSGVDNAGGLLRLEHRDPGDTNNGRPARVDSNGQKPSSEPANRSTSGSRRRALLADPSEDEGADNLTPHTNP